MHILSHLSYPYIIANLCALLLGLEISLEYNLLIIGFSIFPDIDMAYDLFRQLFTKGKYDVPANHHAWFTHWPIVYAPLILIAIISAEPFFIIAASAIYFHLAMDTLYCNEGVMLLYPFSKKWYKYFSEQTQKKKGLDWNKAYAKLRIAKIDKYAFVLVFVHVFYFVFF